MPCTEAMACGVPVMAVNYSAMEDHCKMPGGIPIKVERFFHEPVIETEQRRALPDNKDFIARLDEFIRMSTDERNSLSKRTRAYLEEPAEVWGQEVRLPRFGWERPAATWANVIRSAKIKDPQETWLYPVPRLHRTEVQPPNVPLNNGEFVTWCLETILGKPELVDSYMATEWVRWLNCGYRIEGGNRIPTDRNGLVQVFNGMVEQRNQAELRRIAALVEKKGTSSEFVLV